MNSQLVRKSLIAGISGTIAMTILSFMAPLMSMPEMNVPKMLAGFMHLPVAIGWAAHFMIGIMLALGYAMLFYRILPRKPAVKGIIFSIIPWLMAQLLVMPMMSAVQGMSFTAGIFSGSLIIAAGSLMGHMAFGLILGLTYNPETIYENTGNSFYNA